MNEPIFPLVALCLQRFAWVLLCLGAGACGSSGTDESGNPATAGRNGGPSAGSSGAADQTGTQTGGGPANGGSGTVNGGGANSESGTGGFPAGAPSGGKGSMGARAGGQTQWPDWVGPCLAVRAEKCGGTPDYLVCIYGTDEELASTGVKCDEPLRNYKEYCGCHSSGCPLHCRPEYE